MKNDGGPAFPPSLHPSQDTSGEMSGMTPEREKEIREWVERWKDAPEWAEWWACGGNGEAYWYELEPVYLKPNDYWTALSLGQQGGRAFAEHLPPPDDPESTLERRPDPAIAELLEAISEMRGLLKVAKCPDSNCDGKGTVCLGEYPHENGEVEYHLEQCQWCDKRSALVEKEKA